MSVQIQLAAYECAASPDEMDQAMTCVGQMGQLKHLNLGGSQITDAGLRHLQGLASLQYLDISGTKITDNGLPYLKRMTGLKSLCLDYRGQ